MRTFKSDFSSVLPRTLDVARAFRACIGVATLVRLRGERTLGSEQQLASIVEEELLGAILDEGFAKPSGEIVAFGSAFAPTGKPAPAVDARIQVGAVDKHLLVVGNRRWKNGVATDPEPFTHVRIDDAHAFGGPNHPANPLGKGAAPVDGVHELPNIEDPAHPVRAPKDHPPPAGFGPLDTTHPLRADKHGTYGARWLEHEFPGFASDIDLGYFNTARPDQRIQGFFRGDEAYRIENMHAEHPVLEGTLPGVRARVFVNQRTREGEHFLEVPMHLETIVCLPNVARAVLIFRGTTAVAEDDASDLEHLVAALEDMAEPKTFEHYRAAFEKRLDKKLAARLKDDDLLPSWMAGKKPGGPSGKATDLEGLLATEKLTEKNLRRGMQKQLDEAQKQIDASVADTLARFEEMKKQGIEPPPFTPPAPIPPLPPMREEPLEDEEVDAMIADAEKQMEAAKAQMDQQVAEQLAQARKVCEENGIDFDKKMEEARKSGTGPPKPVADTMLDQLRDTATLLTNAGVADADNKALQQLADPTFEASLRDMDDKTLAAYRELAHYFPAASPLDGEPSEAVRRQAQEDRAAGKSFARRDFTGADLSGLDFSGADFREALLEKADLRGANLAGANFAGAVLVRADLEGATTTGIQLAGANLAEARCLGLDLAGVDLRGAVLLKADLGGANLAGANLDRADLKDASLARANLAKASAHGAQFHDTRLDGASFAGANLSNATFEDADFSAGDFTGATLEATEFLGCTALKAIFRQAHMKNARFSHIEQPNAFSGADFSGADLSEACLLGVELDGADFSGANLVGADFSGAKAERANFHRVSAKGSLWIRTNLAGANLAGANLFEGTLTNANVRGADLRGANLFRANLIRVRVDGTTVIQDAELGGAAFVQNREP